MINSLPLHQFLLIVISVIFVLGIAVRVLIREQATRNQKSANFSVVRAGSSYAKKMGKQISKNTEILMPVGAGLYPLKLSSSKQKLWEDNFENWVNAGAKISVLITNPSEAAVLYWKKLAVEIGEGLVVAILIRKNFSDDDLVEIERLDEYHPVLALENGSPFSMWIEGSHPAGSTEAYAVEYVCKNDIVGIQYERFSIFEKLIRKFIDDPENQHPDQQVAA